MLEPRSHPRLGEEAGLERLEVELARYAGMDGLEGNGAAKGGILGLVDDPHGPAAQLAEDLVSSDLEGSCRLVLAQLEPTLPRMMGGEGAT